MNRKRHEREAIVRLYWYRVIARSWCKMQHTNQRKVSRRRMLRRLAAVASAGVLGALGAAGIFRERPRVVVLPNEAESTGDAVRPPIVSRGEWGALPVDHDARNERGYYERDLNPFGWYVYAGDLRDSYQTLVVHHSAFYKASGRATLLEVQRLHRWDRGWADVGYHFMLDGDGAIYAGRDLAVRGAHTQGRNTSSAGVCLLGDFRYRAPSPAQWDALIALGRWLVAELELTHIAAHSQFNEGTVCPGARVIEQLSALAEILGVGYGVDGYVPAPSSL